MDGTTPSQEQNLAGMRKLSPKRNTTRADSAESMLIARSDKLSPGLPNAFTNHKPTSNCYGI